MLRYAEPQTYLAEPCTYLERRWALDASRPGTVVLPVMFHSVVKEGRAVSDPKDVGEADFLNFMLYAHNQGFETITTAELLAFLQHNAAIPPRSLILILDDRRPGVIENNFMPLLKQYDWSLTPAYITDPDSLAWAWEWMQRLYQSGRLDVQSHGYTGELYVQADTPAEALQHEIWDSTAVLEERFGVRPLAFIWPGGNFSALSVEIARAGGYQLGFSAFSRGPLFFNWIPQGEEERAVGDPLMLLPRAWSNSMPVNIDQALKISEQMIAAARQGYPAEADYYRMYCGGELPPLELLLP